MKLFLALSLVLSVSAHAASDPLTRTSIPVPGPQGDVLLKSTLDDLKGIFQRYVPGLDSGSTLVKPLVVGGTTTRPTVKLSIKKCVAFICQTVDFDSVAEVREVSGSCARNYLLQADLTRSSAQLSDIYDRLDVAGCYKPNADGSGALLIEATAHQAARYSTGIVQREIVKMLELQVGPLTKAIQDSMKAKSAN